MSKRNQMRAQNGQAVAQHVAYQRALARQEANERFLTRGLNRSNSSYAGCEEWGNMGKHDPNTYKAHLVGMNDRVSILPGEFSECYIPIAA